MTFRTIITALAIAVAVGGFCLGCWIDIAILLRNPRHCLRYSIISGMLVSIVCFASFTALAVAQSGERLLGMGIVLSLITGLIAGIGTAISCWIPEYLKKKGVNMAAWSIDNLKKNRQTDITEENNV